MKKALILLCPAILYGAGCSSTPSKNSSSWSREESHRVGTGRHVEQRVQGQFAREAGLHQNRWAVGKSTTAPVEETQTQVPLLPYEAGTQSGPAPVEPITVSSTIPCGLEIVNEAAIELRKEEMVVGKREVSNGGVVIRKVVHTENVSQPVELRREEYVLERVSASQIGQANGPGAGNAFQGQEIYLPLMREEAVTTKRVLLSEGIQVGKRVETDRQVVSAQVRTEDVEVVKNPDLSDPKFSTVPRRTPSGVGQQAIQTAATSVGETASDKIRLAREELAVGKAEVDHGGVYLRKIIRTETASQPVDLKREEFVLERNSLGNQVVSSASFQPQEIRVNLTREEAIVGTRNYPTEFIRLTKKVHTDVQTVAETVRKEDIEIVKQPGSSQYLGQGRPGTASESGMAVLSESGSATTKTGSEKDSAQTGNAGISAR